MTHASHPDTFHLVQGQDVYTSDGERLGAVGEILPSHFEVAESDDDRFWLSKRTIANVDGGRVEMMFPREQLDDYRGEEPASDTASPVLDESIETFDSEGEQEQRRREQMRGYEVTQGRRE